MMDIKNIPGKLKTTCSFCVWKFEKRNGQKTKMPYNPATGERAKINDLRTFSDFKNTLVTYAMGERYSGYCPFHLSYGLRGKISIRERTARFLLCAGRLRLRQDSLLHQ